MSVPIFYPCPGSMCPGKRKIVGWRLAVLLAGIGLGWAGPAAGNILYVSPAGTNNEAGNFPDWAGAANTISAAVAKAVGGDTILVTNAVYTLSSTYINIGTNITVISTNGSGDGQRASVNCNSITRGFYIHNTGAVVVGFSISNGVAATSFGGGVYLDYGTLRDCVIVSNKAYNLGGGVYATNGVVENCVINSNAIDYTWANRGGGIFVVNAVVRNCQIVANSSLIGGGFVIQSGTGMVDGCLISANYGVSLGGGAYIYSGLLCNSTCSWNNANDTGQPRGGGGIYLGSGTVSNCLISNNLFDRNNGNDCGGGGVYMVGGLLTGCRVISNRANATAGYYGNGGGIYISGGTVSNCTICSNKTYRGGGGWGGFGNGVYMVGGGNGGTVCDSIISYNFTAGSESHGGGVYMTNGVLLRCTIVNNSSYWYGGGVYMGNMASKVASCTIQSNATVYSTDSPPYYPSGGGIYGSGTISNCVFQANIARYGGGVEFSGIMRNSLLIGNQSTVNGGGVYMFNAAMENCTVVGNQAAVGGGVYRDTGYTGSATNCIIYSNNATSGWKEICNPSDTLFGFTCSTALTHGANGNITNVPQFINAGSGFGTNHVAGNYRLTAGSPCVNAGTNLPWMTGALDLDGRPRVRAGYGANVDMGPYEFLPRGATFIMR